MWPRPLPTTLAENSAFYLPHLLGMLTRPLFLSTVQLLHCLFESGETVVDLPSSESRRGSPQEGGEEEKIMIVLIFCQRSAMREELYRCFPLSREAVEVRRGIGRLGSLLSRCWQKALDRSESSISVKKPRCYSRCRGPM